MHFTLKKNPMQDKDLEEFVLCYNPANRFDRHETYSEANPDGRWRRFSIEEIMARDKTSLDIFWIKDTIVQELVGEKSLSGLKLLNTKTNSSSSLSVDGLFVAIGHLPQTNPFSGLVPIDSEGFFDIGEDCRTPVPSIYVAGDCRKKNMRQLTTAVADGANASIAVYSTSHNP